MTSSQSSACPLADAQSTSRRRTPKGPPQRHDVCPGTYMDTSLSQGCRDRGWLREFSRAGVLDSCPLIPLLQAPPTALPCHLGTCTPPRAIPCPHRMQFPQQVTGIGRASDPLRFHPGLLNWIWAVHSQAVSWAISTELTSSAQLRFFLIKF